VTATAGIVVIGIGNDHRRDDGIGPAVAAAVAARELPGVRVHRCAAEPTAILDAWEGAGVAVIVDAVMGGVPGRVGRCSLDEVTESATLSSHDLNLRQTYELGRALGRAPAALVVVTIDIADTGYGSGLSPAVETALPHAVAEVIALVEHAQKAAHQ
jgi:hydrogenase maturation protease